VDEQIVKCLDVLGEQAHENLLLGMRVEQPLRWYVPRTTPKPSGGPGSAPVTSDKHRATLDFLVAELCEFAQRRYSFP
jgi:hypothetical protein